jgi:uncharacterized membrane protein
VLVDLWKLVASFQMVQGHTLDALMAETHRSGALFEAWAWTRGLTSVMFLFAAGVSFHLATLTRLDAHLDDARAVRKRFERGLVLIGLGYVMHSVDGPIVDVLQCIGLTLIVLEALAVWLRDARRVTVAAAVLALAAVAAAPFTCGLEPHGVLAPLVHWVSPRGGSIFPIVPWAAYVLAGLVCGALVLPDGARTPRTRVARRLVVLGTAVVAVGLVGARLDLAGAGWVVKLGAVIFLGGTLAAASLGVARLPRTLETLAGETLSLYVSDVVVLYGAGVGLSALVGRSLSLPQALGAALIAIVATAAVGLAWHRLKRAVGAERRAALARRPGTG